MWLRSSPECKQKTALLARCVWYCECLISIPRVHYIARHVTDPSSSTGTPEWIRVHVHHTSDPRPPLPRTPGIPAGPLPTALGGPHASLSPPSRTVVEHGALWAK